MKKTLKFFVTVLVISLALCSLAFIASAEETKPNVISANISYEGDYSILLAVDADTVKGNKVTVEVWKNGEKLKETFTDTTTEIIEKLDNKSCYVVKTPGIAQKDADVEFTYKVTDGEGNFSEGKISVAEYLYTRLFVNGIINATEDSDATEGDKVRRDFYIDTLEHAAKAQNLLYNFNSNPDDDIDTFVTDLYYANVPGYTFENGYSTALLAAAETITLPGTGNYIVTKYALNNFAKTEEYVAAGAEITINAHTVVTAEKPFVFGEGNYYKNEAASSAVSKYDYTSTNVNLEGIGETDKAELVDGKLVYTRAEESTGQSYLRWNNPGALTNPTSLMYVFETDIMFNDLVAAKATTQRIRFQLNGGAGKYIDHTLYLNANPTSGNTETLTIGQFELSAGKWYNIGFVFDFAESKLNYYLNGVLVGSEAVTLAASGSSNRVLWYYAEDNQTSGAMNYDNTFLGWVEKPIVLPEFVAGIGAYYTAGNLAIKTDGSSTSNFKHSNNGTNQGMSITSITEGSNSVVQVVSDGAKSGGAATYLDLRASGTIDTATQKYVFETDFKFDKFTATNTDLGDLQFRIGSNSMSIANTASATGDVTVLNIGKMKLDAGEWYNIRFVIDFATGAVEYFVNGISVGSETIQTVAGDNYVRFLWNFNSTSTYVDMKFDNTTFGYIAK